MSELGQWQPISRVRAQPRAEYELLFIDNQNRVCTMSVTGLELTRLSPTVEPVAARMTDPGPEPIQWLGTVLWNYVRGRVVKRASENDPVILADIGQGAGGQPRVRYRPRNGERK